ncbi:hypothetical protein SLEP1_g28529 [Rubroshorea leprosula]|uniref:Uncharacterized protein n=1 Tax=Rubroshorea leprosula TaxID=152421 RepID=A0AAV5K2M4_9ROSI|nr:hypothetical protein SLEP1_g28529 [Rubroshorea leprosula]
MPVFLMKADNGRGGVSEQQPVMCNPSTSDIDDPPDALGLP